MANNLHLIAKGGLVVLIIISFAVLIERLTNKDLSYLDLDPGIRVIDDDIATMLPINDDDDDVKAIQKCLNEHSESVFFPLDEINTTSSCSYQLGECMRYTLISFSELMKSFGIKLRFIEPSTLFCLLPSTRKFSVLTRGFDIVQMRGSGNVMTFAIFPSEAETLDQAISRLKIAKAGFRIRRFPNWLKSDLINLQKPGHEFSTAHYFIIHKGLVIHLVPFYRRGTYNWSPSFNSSGGSSRGLLFVNSSALEDFTVLPRRLSVVSNAEIYLPADARQFLLDMMSSNFLECGIDQGITLTKNSAALMALKEVRTVLSSQMVIFWLWSRSLQGWYEKCDILSYSNEINLAIAAKSVEGYNFTALFTYSQCQHIENYSNLNSIVKIELRCHDLTLNIFLMYEDEETYWYEHYDGKNTYKLSFPKFTLCSTDVYGLKINLPCETREMLHSEYGQFLRNATLQLNPETMRNVALETEKSQLLR